MEKKKIVSVDLGVMKERLAKAGNAAVALVLDKGILLTEKQLKALEKARAAKG